jgi:hypothetical protein
MIHVTILSSADCPVGLVDDINNSSSTTSWLPLRLMNDPATRPIAMHTLLAHCSSGASHCSLESARTGLIGSGGFQALANP